MSGDEAAETFHFGLSGLHCRTNGGDITSDENCDVPATQFFPRNHLDRRGL